MLKNVLLSLINISITAIPFFLIWDFEMYLVAILFQIVIIACTFWNIAGDVLIIRTVLNGKGIPNNSQIKSATTKYLNYLESKDLIETQKQKLIYWANSSVPYFLPVSKRTFVISSALQDYLVRQGAQALIKQFPNEMFATSIIFSRKILLLTVLSYRIIMKVLEWWGIFFLYAAAININLGVFNLLPIPPLDGSRLLTALLPSKYYYKIMQYERYIMIGLFVLLFTGILTTPLSFLSSLILGLFSNITQIPFEMMMR